MAKNMAKIKNGVVINIEWCSDKTAETNTLKNTNNLHVGIGDTYSKGKFYRDGEQILSMAERLANAEAELAKLLEGN